MDGLAIYAAVVATGSASWQVYTWLRSRRTRVEVSVKAGLIYVSMGVSQPIVTVMVVNRSEHTVYVRSGGVRAADEARDGLNLHFTGGDHGSTLPGPIAPRNRGTLTVGGDLSDDLESGQPVSAWVVLETGEVCESKPTMLTTL